MAHHILSDMAASISELKKNPMAAVNSANGKPIAILNRNEPVFYCVPAKAWEQLMEQLEDADLLAIAKERIVDESFEVSLDEL